MIKLLPFITIVLLSISCIKTADQVHREKRFDSMSDQMGDTQGLVANMVLQMKDMQSQLDKLHGRLEEVEYKQSKMDPEAVKKMTQSLAVFTSQQEGQSAQLLQIQNEVQSQRLFMEKVTATLAELKKAPVVEKKNARSELSEGLTFIKKDKYPAARSTLEALINNKDLSAGENNKLLHGLGKVEYYTGHYDKAMVYFSKIITKYPRASLAPSSLLFIGRSLTKMGKKEEAKQAYLKVVEDYKDSKEAYAAKKEL